jgi:hypothetical protein
VGFGTGTPSVELHSVNGDTPTLRLDQNASSGFAPQVWDIAGNEGGFFIRDVTNGTRVPLRIRPGAPSSSIDIAATGFVGLNTTSPLGPLHLRASTVAGATPHPNSDTFIIEDNASGGMQFMNPDASSVSINFGDPGSNQAGRMLYVHGDDSMRLFTGAAERLRILSNGNVGIGQTAPTQTLHVQGNILASGTITPGSSRAFKDNIEPLGDAEAFAAFASLAPVKYTYKADAAGDLQLGFIAEDVPELVAIPERNGISPMDLIAVLTKVVQNQQAVVQDQQAALQGQQAVVQDQQAAMQAQEQTIERLQRDMETLRQAVDQLRQKADADAVPAQD